MGAPQIIVIILYSMIFTSNLARHGEPRDEEYHAGLTLASIALWVGLLYWGGFFG